MSFYGNVTGLDISYSGHENLNGLDLENVIKLNASHNKLHDLPNMFREESGIEHKLSEIDFSHNFIGGVPYFLTKFNGLKVIRLSHNRIENINIKDFAFGLPNLELIDLSNNPSNEVSFTNYISQTEILSKTYCTWN